ncbi:hypothetical protein QJQ45_008956 [Haematococcus lacustris]|nr:hypothetical protein QJQ45_008956 [Haematococcus lacustris]
MSKPEHDELRRQITDLLAKGLIEPSSSPFAAPVLFVQKKSGELRMCIDYRQLNKITIRDQYPLPRIDDLFDQLAGKTVFSSLDLQAGYHQIRIPAEDVPKTAFRTPEGHYQFKVLCFGLTNAPATFQRVMNEAFAEVINDCALVYLDDILVMSENTEQHLVHLRRVFDLLRKNKFYAKLSKCEFMKRTLMFLGHIISAQGISVDPCKVTAISNWPVPTSLKTLQSFLGAANYVRKFVHNFSTIAAPLTNLTGPKKDSFPWKSWPQAELDAFNALKQAIANVPMLKLPDHSKPFQVHCDASLEGIGAVLMQDGYPLAYYSRKLIPAEVNYTTGEQELLALVSACQQWRCYLEGVPFTLYTDHRPLISLPTQNILSRRQTRWMEFLARFSYTIEYLPGISNPADPLSRIPAATVQTCKGPGADNVKSILVMTRSKRRSQEEEETGAEARKTSAGDAAAPPTQPPPGQGDGAAVRPPTKRVTWAADVPADGEPSAPKPPGPLSNLHEWLVRAYATDSNFTKRRKTKNYYLDDNGLWRHNKRRTVIVPRDKQLREHILHEMHDAKYAGHVGITKTLERVMRVFWKSSDSVFQVGDRVLLSTMNLRNMVGKARKLLPRDLQAALNPAGTSANHSRPGTGPLDDDLLNDEEEAEDEDVQPDEDEEEEDEAEQLREELAATRSELIALRIRQRNMDRALSSLAAQAVPGPDKWTDACIKSVRRASAFCDDLEAHCARYSLDIVSVFPAFLSGAARNAWYPSVQQAHFAQTGVAPPRQFLRVSFLEYTGDDLRDDMLEARDRLLDRSIRMGPSYPELSDYLIAFRNNLLTAGAQCMDESLLVNLFVTGLSPSLRETVLKDIVPLQNPTLTQAIDSARQAQRNAVFLAGAVNPKRHVAAVQGRAITERAEHEIHKTKMTVPSSARQASAPRSAGRQVPRQGGMRPGPPPAAAGKKAGAAAAATAVKPGQYCHHCYSPDHLKPQCPWKHLPAKQAREQSGYSRPPAGANVPQKRSRPDDDEKGQGKGKLATANAK